MTAEWMPENPCPCKDPIGDPADVCMCEESIAYSEQKVGQRKLLEYLIVAAKDTPTADTQWIPLYELEQMLKELEKNNGK
jgi:hypothetical protein